MDKMKIRLALAVVVLVTVPWLFIGREDRGQQGEKTEISGASTSSVLRSEGNQPPQILRVEIVPPAPDLDAVLKAHVQAQDPEQDTITFRYRWMVNQKEVSDRSVLTLEGYRQGDSVAVELTPVDEKGVGTPIMSSAVQIGNNPPLVKTIKLLPREIKAGQEIQAEVEGVDKEDDPIHYEFEWQINGKPVKAENRNVLDGSLVHSADKIAVIVVPADSFSEGSPKVSPLITVMNQPPEIISFPPTNVQDDPYTYQVVAKDPDGDVINYKLVNGPKGMDLDAKSGLLRWRVEAFQDGKASVEIRADDAKGGKSIQRFQVKTP